MYLSLIFLFMFMFMFMFMKVSVKSYVYYALCELSDSLDNLESFRSHFKDDSFLSSYLDSIVSDVESALNKLHNIPI